MLDGPAAAVASLRSVTSHCASLELVVAVSRDVADEASVVGVGRTQEDHVQVPHVAAVPAAAGIRRRWQVGVDLVLYAVRRAARSRRSLSPPTRQIGMKSPSLGVSRARYWFRATDGGGDARVGDIVQGVAGRERHSRAAVLDPVAHSSRTPQPACRWRCCSRRRTRRVR